MPRPPIATRPVLPHTVPILLAAAGIVTPLVGVENAPDLGTALTEGSVDFAIRPRYEYVDQDGIPNEAHALTLRIALGYTTGVYWDSQLFVGFETTQVADDSEFTNPVDPQPGHPVVADPQHAELNLYGLRYLGVEDATFTVGRQRILHDHARFVGNVGWRQNEQTFDAVTADYVGIEDLALTYSMVFNVNRIFSDEAPSSPTGVAVTGDDRMLGHLAHAAYDIAEYGTASVFAYVLDYEHKAALDRATFGTRFAGAYDLGGDWAVTYAATLAHQSDLFDNENEVSELYYQAALGAKWKGLTVEIGYEVLGGDGDVAFQTPLATLHAFNGWADKFLNTPASGLTDLSLTVGGPIPAVDGLTAKAAYHIFESEDDGESYGTELDLLAIYSLKSIDPAWKVGAKVALYREDGHASDTTKFWLWTQWGF